MAGAGRSTCLLESSWGRWQLETTSTTSAPKRCRNKHSPLLCCQLLWSGFWRDLLPPSQQRVQLDAAPASR